MLRVARWIPFIALIIFSLSFFYKLAFSDMILARGDTYHYFYPYWDARNAAFRAGELPLWTADIFMGAPLLANPQIGTFYPPNWLTTPFTAPDAVRISILMHIVWAAIGMFILFRQVVQRSIVPPLLAAAIFAFGGYLGAHVEQINQLQGLAWMPWLFYLYHRTIHDNRRFLWLIFLAMAWAIQIFSGHTQTVFVSGLGLGIYAFISTFSVGLPVNMAKTLFTALLLLILAAILAVLLAIPQMLPTLELIGMSNRGGGFNPNQATAFSLPPHYLGRALLPSYDGQLFGEYIGYVGVIALGLAIYGSIIPTENNRSRWIWIVIAMIGLLFAFGRFNPLYWYLADLPGFNLFRVPARWLSLYTFGIAILAGYGLIALQSCRIAWPRVVITVVPLILLMVMGRVLPILQDDIVGSATPSMTTLLGWGIALLLLIIVFALKIYNQYQTNQSDSVGEVSILSALKIPMSTGEVLILSCIVLELFFASRILPYNDLAPRDVYLGQRFTISQMLAYTEGQTPPGRVLSVSGRFFDPGDISTLRERYKRMGMDEQAQHTAFTAVKNQEILFPNLGLTWGIPTVDGFGGGVLPTIYYSQFTSLLLPEGMPRTVDGRLVENLAQAECRGACIPDWRFLSMTDTRYIITDKVYDIWHDGVAFDTTLADYWIAGLQIPNFNYTEFRVLHTGNLAEFEEFISIDEDLRVTLLQLDELRNLFQTEAVGQFLAITAVDTRTGDFLQLQPAGINRILSSDVKIYEAPFSTRASIMPFPVVLPDDWQGHEDALVLMQNADFIPLKNTVIHGDAEKLSGEGQLSFTQYSDTAIEITVNTSEAAYLVLADAYYPGWRVTVNGEETPIYRANVMFRAVRVPAGESTVIFEFVPMLWYYAMAFGGVIWLLGLGTIFFSSARIKAIIHSVSPDPHSSLPVDMLDTNRLEVLRL
jgi:hypothetical protein